MAIKQNKGACSNCHAAKVKCVFDEGASKCRRCTRLGLKCTPHVSRQGQGTRRRKKTKVKPTDNVDQALAISTALSPICEPGTQPIYQEPKPLCPQSSGIKLLDCPKNSVHPASEVNALRVPQSRYNDDDGLCSGMDKLEVEDSLLCKSITNGMGKDHFGLNVLIRMWVSLAFSRRSFSLLARASFIAAKMQIPMDDIIANQSPFANVTDSQPMEFLARDLLLAKGERKTLGYDLDLQEVPWDLLDAVQVDPNYPLESASTRWIAIRWTIQGITRFWASPLFQRDFATTEVMGDVYAANSPDKEVIDLFLAKSEKGKFAQGLFNLLFVNHKPNMEPFVIKNEYRVVKKNNPVPIVADCIQTLKVVDLDSQYHYIEVQFRGRKIDHLMGDKTSSANKREHVDVYVDNQNQNNNPLMGDGIEFTDIEVTDEMEEFLKLIGGD